MATAAAAIGMEQIYLAVSGSLEPTFDLLADILVPLGVLGLFFAVVWAEGQPLRRYGFCVRGGGALSVTYAALFALVFLTIRLEPGFVFGFGREASPSSLGFAFGLFYAPTTGLANGAVFFGLLFRRLTLRVPFLTAMTVASMFFALGSTNLVDLPSLPVDTAVQVLFTGALESFVLGLVLALYFYKDQWSLLGPVTLEAVILGILLLFPYVANFPSWADAFAATLIAYGTLLVAITFLLREPRLQAQKYIGRPAGPRRFRFRERAANRQALRDLAVGAVVLVAVVGVVDVGLPAVAGTPSSPFLAIATGSMVPTFHRGTLVVIEKASPAEIHVGTIIAFHVSCLPAPTVHRVYKILVSGSSPVYLTKGDANPAPDPCDVPFSHVIGRAVYWIPDVGYLILDPLLAAALIVLAVVSLTLLRDPRGR